MKRILFLLFAIGLSAGMTVMAGMSTSKIRKETRFLTDKMAYELNLTTQQYNDAYEINYDFIYSVRNIMDYVARGYEWAMDDYYEALDIRNDDLRFRTFLRFCCLYPLHRGMDPEDPFLIEDMLSLQSADFPQTDPHIKTQQDSRPDRILFSQKKSF